jgi:hypothetical protein
MAGDWARATVVRAFTWERCGAATLAAYREALTPAPARTGATTGQSRPITRPSRSAGAP